MAPRRRGAASGNLTPEQENFLLTGHDFFSEHPYGEPPDAERISADWELHGERLTALWLAPRATPETDPLFWTAHGPRTRPWAEKFLRGL
jgi:hypothetical protein